MITRAKLAIVVGAASALAMLSACSPGSGSEPTSDAEGTGGDFTTCADVDLSAAPDSPAPLRLAGATGIEAYAGWFMMDVSPEEYRPNAGVWYELDNQPFPDPAQRIAALQAGQVDGMLSSMPQILTLEQAGINASAVAEIARVVNDSPGDYRFIVDADSDIESFADVEGRTIGTIGLGTTNELLARMAIDSAGVDPDSVQYVNVPPAQHISAVEAGTVDVALGTPPFLAPALDSGTVRDIGSQSIGLKEETGLDYVEPLVLTIADSYLEENPEVVCAYLADYRASLGWLADNLDEARALFSEKELIAIPIDVYQSLPAPDLPPGDALPALEFYLATAPYAQEYGFVPDGSEEAVRAVIWSGLGEVDG